MILEFIAFIAAGFALAGIVMLINRISGNRLPRWLIPASIGAGMIAFAVWSEYSWFGRTAATLPDGVVVASDNAHASFYRPWTHVVPIVSRFVAVDTRVTRRLESRPEVAVTSIILLGRWERGAQYAAAFDCEGARRFDFVDEAAGGAGGPEGLPRDDGAWVRLDADDPVLAVACGEV